MPEPWSLKGYHATSPASFPGGMERIPARVESFPTKYFVVLKLLLGIPLRLPAPHPMKTQDPCPRIPHMYHAFLITNGAITDQSKQPKHPSQTPGCLSRLSHHQWRNHTRVKSLALT